MDTKFKGKLERYLKNSSHFLWGVILDNRDGSYRWLRNTGKKLWGENFDFKKSPYNDVTNQLLINPGIEKLLKDMIVPRIKKELFSEKALEFLRVSWNAGILPSMPYLKQYRMDNDNPFLEINKQFNYVERWSEWAGIWFEEIEPYLSMKGEK